MCTDYNLTFIWTVVQLSGLRSGQQGIRFTSVMSQVILEHVCRTGCGCGGRGFLGNALGTSGVVGTHSQRSECF